MIRMLIQVAILTLTVQSLVDCSCFDEYSGNYLTTYAKKVDGRSEEECPGSCLTYPDLCQSAQYDRSTGICYLNIETHLSIPNMYKPSENYVYWYRKRECQPNCHFVYYWKKYLLGYNDMKYSSYSSRQCMEACLLNKNYDCKSVDFGRSLGDCTLSRESKETKPSAWKPHITLEHFHKICKSDTLKDTPCFEQEIFGTYMNNHAAVFLNNDEASCQRLCFTADKFVCRSVHYDQSTRKCYLNKETHLSQPNWVKKNDDYVYWMRDQKCNFNCRLVFNYRIFLQGYSLGEFNGYSDNQCLQACYENANCKSFDYNRQLKLCRLHHETKLTKPHAVKSSVAWYNFHKICHQVEKNYDCFTSYSKRYLDDKYTDYSDKTEEECVKLCIFGEIPCSSASYNKKTRTCYLSRKTKSTHKHLYKTNNDYRYFEKHSDCQSDCVVMTFPNYYINGNSIRSTSADSDIECLRLCLTEQPSGYCKSVSWRRNTKTCILHDESRLTKPNLFRFSSQYTHWHISCIGDLCYNEHPFRYLTGQHYSIESDSSEGECKSLCLKSEEGCRSAYYDVKGEKCYLSKETKLSKPSSYKAHNNMVYWERRSVCQLDCYMKEYDNSYLIGRNTKTVKVTNQLECKQLCFLEKSFNCKSAEYQKRTKMCYLSTENRKTSGVQLTKSSQYTYWEKECGRTYPCFDKYHGKYLRLKYYKVEHGVSEETCAYRCEISLCRSANYNSLTKTCYLSKVTKKDHPSSYLTNKNYLYLEKKASCKPDCYYRRYLNRYLNGFNNMIRSAPSETACLKLCLNYRQWCKSVDYQKISKRCYLSSKDQSDGNGLKVSYLYNYHELTCEDETKDYPCFTAYPKKYITGHTNKILNGQTEQSCLQACLLANFVCRSAEYSSKHKRCYLSVQSKTTKPLNYKNHGYLTYYHRKSECHLNCPIKTWKNKVLAKLNMKWIVTSSDYDCLNECLTTQGCNSAERNRITKRCYLQKETKDTKPGSFQSHFSYTYWHMTCDVN